jgi:hypothetical protein
MSALGSVVFLKIGTLYTREVGFHGCGSLGSWGEMGLSSGISKKYRITANKDTSQERSG